MNKENETAVVSGPQTPAHLMKKQVNNKDIDPKRSKLRMKRLPLASKDSNRSNNVGPLKSGKLAVTRNASLHFKKYGSILHQDIQENSQNGGLPRVKSLVLNDLDSDHDSEEEELGLNNKLQNVLQSRQNGSSNNNSNTKEFNGLFGKNGLANLVNQQRDVEDREIEYVSIKEDEIPYIPDGYSMLDEADINKLKEFHYEMPPLYEQDSPDHEDEKPLALMELHDITDDEDRPHITPVVNNTLYQRDRHVPLENNNNNDHLDLLSIDSEYDSRGLDADDIADLLS